MHSLSIFNVGYILVKSSLILWDMPDLLSLFFGKWAFFGPYFWALLSACKICLRLICMGHLMLG